MFYLNSILKLKVPIRELQILNTESNDEITAGKRVYFDVLCEDEEGNSFIVEMQNVWQGFLKNRLIYYACTICLLNDIGKDSQEQTFRQDIILQDVENGRSSATGGTGRRRWTISKIRECRRECRRALSRAFNREYPRGRKKSGLIGWRLFGIKDCQKNKSD